MNATCKLAWDESWNWTLTWRWGKGRLLPSIAVFWPILTFSCKKFYFLKTWTTKEWLRCWRALRLWYWEYTSPRIRWTCSSGAQYQPGDVGSSGLRRMLLGMSVACTVVSGDQPVITAPRIAENLFGGGRGLFQLIKLAREELAAKYVPALTQGYGDTNQGAASSSQTRDLKGLCDFELMLVVN